MYWFKFHAAVEIEFEHAAVLNVVTLSLKEN